MKTFILTAVLVGAIAKSLTTWPLILAALLITALVTPNKAPKWWSGSK